MARRDALRRANLRKVGAALLATVTLVMVLPVTPAEASDDHQPSVDHDCAASSGRAVLAEGSKQKRGTSECASR